AHMEWALEEREGVSDLLEYEARCDAWFNTVPQNERHPVICAYDLTKFSADVIIDVLRTHPMVIVGGVLQENPFYIPPHQFLQELRVRRARQGAPVEAALN
ncbi:MAG: MEDS domain-containing protein, partial [Burkholderiales bacterium]